MRRHHIKLVEGKLTFAAFLQDLSGIFRIYLCIGVRTCVYLVHVIDFPIVFERLLFCNNLNIYEYLFFDILEISIFLSSLIKFLNF